MADHYLVYLCAALSNVRNAAAYEQSDRLDQVELLLDDLLRERRKKNVSSASSAAPAGSYPTAPGL